MAETVEKQEQNRSEYEDDTRKLANIQIMNGEYNTQELPFLEINHQGNPNKKGYRSPSSNNKMGEALTGTDDCSQEKWKMTEEKGEEEAELDVDKALALLGDWSKWKLRIFATISVWVNTVASWQIFGIVFIGLKSPHHCALPEGHTVNDSIPFIMKHGKRLYDSCRVWRNYSSSTNDTIPCPHGWDYTGRIRDSIVNEWDLVCDKAYITSTSQTILFIGIGCGAVTLSIFSDKFGRKKMLIMSSLALTALGLITANVQNINSFLALRFFTGFFSTGVELGGYVYISESFPASRRMLVVEICGMFWGASVATLSFTAWLFKEWRTFTIVSALPGLLALPMIWFLPETVPWLVAKGRAVEAKKILASAAKLSGVILPSEFSLPADNVGTNEKRAPKCQAHFWLKLKMTIKSREFKAKDKASNYSISDIAKSVRLVLFTAINAYLWCVCGLVYYGINLNVEALYGDLYVNFMVMGLVVPPALLIAGTTMNFFGRRWPLFTFYLTAGIPLFILPFIPGETADGTNLKPLVTTLVMISYMSIATCFSSMNGYTQELYPTTLRNVGIGIAASICRLGNFVAPFTPIMAEMVWWLPNIFFGSLAIMAGLLILLLPETKGRALARTIEEVEEWPCMLPQGSKIRAKKKMQKEHSDGLMEVDC